MCIECVLSSISLCSKQCHEPLRSTGAPYMGGNGDFGQKSYSGWERDWVVWDALLEDEGAQSCIQDGLENRGLWRWMVGY